MVRVRVGRDVRGRIVVLDARARHGVESAAALALEVVDPVELVMARVWVRVRVRGLGQPYPYP